MKKQNWLYKFISRLCNRNKKKTEATLQFKEEKLSCFQFKLDVSVNTDSESYIEYMICTEMAKFLIDNNLINYSLFEIKSLNNGRKSDKRYNVVCDFTFCVKPNKTNVFDKNTDFNSLSRMFSNPDANFNKNPNSNENPQIP